MTMTTTQRNKLDAARFRRLIAIIEASATKVGTIAMDNGHRELLVSKDAFGETETATVTIRNLGVTADNLAPALRASLFGE